MPMDSVAKSRALRPSWMVEEDTDVPASVPAPLAANMSADANGGGPMVGADGAALVPSSNSVPHSTISAPLGGEMGGGEMSAVPMGGATGPAAYHYRLVFILPICRISHHSFGNWFQPFQGYRQAMCL